MHCPVGLERFFRLIQSFFMILTSYPSLITLIFPFSPPSVHVSAETSLFQLQSNLNITRRSMRLFRFLDSLNVGYSLYANGPVADKDIVTWLDILGKSCYGMFGLLESVTLPDLLGVDHLEIFGPARTKELNIQAQMFWFLGLYASVLTTCIRLVRLFAYSPVPQAGSFGEKVEEDNSPEGLKAAAEKSKAERKAWARQVSVKSTALGFKLISDVLDLVLPANAVGWIRVHPGVLGIAMFCSSITSSKDVWDKCGRTA